MRLYKNNYAVLYRRTPCFGLPMISSIYTVTSVSRPADRTLIRALLRSSIIRFSIIVRYVDQTLARESSVVPCSLQKLHFTPWNVILGRKVKNFRSAPSETRDAVHSNDFDYAVRFLDFFKNKATFPLLLLVRWGKKMLTLTFD